MKGTATAAAITAVALLTAGVAQAQQRAVPTPEQIFCRDLQRIVRAAPDFVAMYKAKAAPPWLGFRPGACQAFTADATNPATYACHQNLAPAHLTLDSLAAITAACIPDAKRLPAEYRREAVFEVPGLRIRINEHGTARGKVGRFIGFRVEARP
jgi:hypothetical protein